MAAQTSSSTFEAYCVHAHQLWGSTDDLELQKKNQLRGLLSLKTALIGEPVERRSSLQDALKAAESQLTLVQNKLGPLKTQALRATERATALKWGVRLGHRYTVRQGAKLPVTDFRVEFVRPAHDNPHQFICTGTAEGCAHLFILGRDDLTFESHSPTNLVSLEALLAARRR